VGTVVLLCVVAVVVGTLVTLAVVIWEFFDGLWTRFSAWRQGKRKEDGGLVQSCTKYDTV